MKSSLSRTFDVRAINIYKKNHSQEKQSTQNVVRSVKSARGDFTAEQTPRHARQKPRENNAIFQRQQQGKKRDALFGWLSDCTCAYAIFFVLAAYTFRTICSMRGSEYIKTADAFSLCVCLFYFPPVQFASRASA